MFGFGKKKSVSEDKNLYTPLAGTVIDLEKVSDPVFAKKLWEMVMLLNPQVVTLSVQ